MPGRGAAGGLHRHPAGAGRAGAAGLGAVGAGAHHHRPRAWLADATLARVERDGAGAGSQLAATEPDDVAAILFTSGSTGVPKGVVYRHRHFVAQIAMLRDAFGIGAGGVDLPTFPPFALFDPALGLTSVIPDMDPTKPALADPRKLHDAIARFGVDQLFGSPALMAVLAGHGAALPTREARDLRRRAGAGRRRREDARAAARRRAVLDAVRRHRMPAGGGDRRPRTAGHARGDRSAAPAPASVARSRPTRCASSRISDEAIARVVATTWKSRPGVVGEITVAGPTVTDLYFNREAQTRLAKIRERLADGSERVVHRMGDVGYFDAQGRLWFCGRKSHRVETAQGPLYTEQVEPVFNTHPRRAPHGAGRRRRAAARSGRCCASS